MLIVAWAGRSPSRITYECGYCRNDDKKIKDDEGEDDEKAATKPNTKAAAPKKVAPKKVAHHISHFTTHILT